MTSVLLDHPWPVEAVLDASTEAFDVLRKFEDLTRRHRLAIVPFISQTELGDMWTRMDYRNTRQASFAALRRMAALLVRETEGHCLARPVPEPLGLANDWLRALRDVTAADDWRSPQIVVPRQRRALWPAGQEVEIHFDACDEVPASGPYQRVLTSLESYEAHPFALSDVDPWDLRHIFPPPAGAPAHRRQACCLPKPPRVEGVALEDLRSALENARAIGWRIGARRYFIPPENWLPENIGKNPWRAGLAFERELVRERDRVGYVDYMGTRWIWDNAERHWDVQTNPYLRLRCTGEEL